MNNETKFVTLEQAINLAEKGNFVSHESFDSYESMHYYSGKLYYEDGAVVSKDFLMSRRKSGYMTDKWFIRIPEEKIDQDKLKRLHEKSNGYMISMYGLSYMDAKKED